MQQLFDCCQAKCDTFVVTSYPLWPLWPRDYKPLICWSNSMHGFIWESVSSPHWVMHACERTHATPIDAHWLKQTHTHTQIQTRELKGDLWSCKNTLRDEWLRLVVPVKQHLQHVAFMFSRQERDREGEWLSILDRHNEWGGVNVTPGSQVELMHVKTLASGVSK